MESIHVHSANQDQEGTYALHRDGKLCLCPKLMFPQIVPVQRSALHNQVDYQTNLNRLPCTTACPFAQVKERGKLVPTETGSSVVSDEKESVYEISCEGGVREIVLDSVEEFKKEPPVSPLQLVAK